MLDTFLGFFKWFLIVAVIIAVIGIFLHLILPLIIVAIIAGLVYYFYKKGRLAKERAKYTPEGRKKVN